MGKGKRPQREHQQVAGQEEIPQVKGEDGGSRASKELAGSEGETQKTLAHPQNSRWKYLFGRSTQIKNKELSAVAPYDVEPRALSSR